MTEAVTAARIFDGERLLEGMAVVIEAGVIKAIVPKASIDARDLGDVILTPGFVDIQVNGGGGVLFNNDISLRGIRAICAAHRSLGTAWLLTTLITDTASNTDKAIGAALEAEAERVPGFAGLHLEGPHLSVARKGAHDPALIRPMEATDLERLLEAKERLQTLLVTVAPENVTPAQIAILAKAGIIVSLGHSDCSYDSAMRCFEAGASMVTHLFNAMSQLTNREPGLTGAALAAGAVSAGLIADAIHVHPSTIATALRAKAGSGSIFLVTDAMATAGSDIQSFDLNGRTIHRHDGRLTLADGTLAGADIDMVTNIRTLVEKSGAGLEYALAMATRLPVMAISRKELGRIAVGMRAEFSVIDKNFTKAKYFSA